jgi:hypothetical protein
MRAFASCMLLALAAHATAQDTRRLDPYNPGWGVEVLAGGTDRTNVVLTTVRRAIAGRSLAVGGTIGWLTNRPPVHRNGTSGGSPPNTWWAYWSQKGVQQFIMLGPTVDAALPIGPSRIEARFSVGLLPWAHGTHRANDYTRCTNNGPPTYGSTCVNQGDTTVTELTQRGEYWSAGLGVRRGKLSLSAQMISVDRAWAAIQYERNYWPLVIGFRF